MLLWMLYTISTGLLLFVAALAGEQAARSWSLPSRGIWIASLIGSVALGSIAWLAPTSTFAESPLFVAAPEALTTDSALVSRAITASNSEVFSAIAESDRMNRTLAVMWLGLSLSAIATILVTSESLRRRRRSWRAASIDGTDVLITDGLGPAVIGFFQPVIVIPEWAFGSSEETRRMMVRHEEEHLHARDQHVLALSLGILALAPWNLALWLQFRRLRHAIEVDCDSRVLRTGVDRRTYGALLMEVSQRPLASAAQYLSLFQSTSQLERRIALLVDDTRRRSKSFSIACSALGALLLVIATVSPRPLSPSTLYQQIGYVEDTTLDGKRSKPMPYVSPLRTMQNAVARGFPRMYSTGAARGSALWFAVDREDRVLAGWLGPTWSEEEWKRLNLSERFPNHWLIPTLYDIAVGDGKRIPIVWAKEVKPWEVVTGGADSPRLRALLRDQVERDYPAFFAGTIRSGDAVWYLQDPSTGAFLRRWTAPAIARSARAYNGDTTLAMRERKAQWEFARRMVPGVNTVIVSNVDVIGGAGQRITVVLVDELKK